MVKISVGELHAMAEGAAEWGWLSGYGWPNGYRTFWLDPQGWGTEKMLAFEGQFGLRGVARGPVPPSA